MLRTGGNDLKICMKCKRAFEDEKKVCDFCGEPLIEIRETDGVKKERIKKNPMAFAVIGIAIALPLGILVARYRKIAEPVIGITAIFQTIPSLALTQRRD